MLRPFADLDVNHVWDLVEVKDGVMFAAAGDEGKVFKITADAKASIVYSDESSRPFCLAPAGDDSVYVGAGPNGRILRIDEAGKVKTVCETGEPYVWSLAVDAKTGTLYAGTGPHGRVLKIGPEGKAEVLYTAKQDHVLCVAAGPDGSVYAGVDKGGLVYRIDAKGKAFVMYQAASGGGSHPPGDGRRCLCGHQHPYQASRRGHGRIRLGRRERSGPGTVSAGDGGRPQ